jgi:tRNA pseudouridine55 synthase
MMDLVINLNKPKGITSREATTEIQKVLKAKKAGHTGTLDPIATGLLLVCINRATRASSYFFPLNKEYRAVMKLGETTDTQDSSGRIIERAGRFDIDRLKVEGALRSFKGRIMQEPPMFSALKYKGKPLYKYARKGIDISRKPREVFIHRIELLSIDLPFVSFDVVCSKGTYIRTLCHDIGKKLGVGAHLYGLERTAIGPFTINDSISMEELSSIDLHHPSQRGLYTIDEALSWLPELTVPWSLVRPVRNGSPLKIEHCSSFSEEMKTAMGIRIKSPDGELLAIGGFSMDKHIIKMDFVLAT